MALAGFSTIVLSAISEVSTVYDYGYKIGKADGLADALTLGDKCGSYGPAGPPDNADQAAYLHCCEYCPSINPILVME